MLMSYLMKLYILIVNDQFILMLFFIFPNKALPDLSRML